MLVLLEQLDQLEIKGLLVSRAYRVQLVQLVHWVLLVTEVLLVKREPLVIEDQQDSQVLLEVLALKV